MTRLAACPVENRDLPSIQRLASLPLESRAQSPLSQPAKTKRSPAPLIHAASRRVRQELYRMYGLFVAAFREAAEQLKAGDRSVWFPEGSFPPGLPFVKAGFAPAG